MSNITFSSYLLVVIFSNG